MIKKDNKNEIRKKRHLRVRSKISGTAEMPRLNVYRSTTHIYAQIVNDETGKTLVSSSSIAKGVDVKGKTKTEASVVVGKDLAAKAIKAGIKQVVFDRGGYLYTGRVKALADAARDGGLEF